MVEKTGYGSVSNDVYRRRSSLEVYRTFLGDFNSATGARLVVLLGFLTALGVSGLIGVVPQVATQRFAEVNYGLEEGIDCKNVVEGVKPAACIDGGDYAQGAASYSVLVRNLLALLTNSWAGSYSDTHGRRGVQIFALFLMVANPLSFLAIQICPRIHPIWYYIFDGVSGILSSFSIGFTQLSDVLPPKHRAPAFGLFFASFMAGIAVSPFLATLMSPIGIAIFSSAVRMLALIIAIVWLPETLSEKSRLEAVELEESQEKQDTVLDMILQPLRKLEILQRSSSLLLVAFGAFVSKMVFSADLTLFFYYIESNLGATVQDVANMLFATGILGVVVQAGLLKYLISLVGERRLLIASFGCGVIHNLIYGFATNKTSIFVGICVAPFTNLGQALISSQVSRMVASTEQGQVQGALFGLSALAEAVGPVIFNFIYRKWHTFGPGTMFVVGAMLYGLGAIAVSLVPPKRSISEETDEVDETLDGSEEEQRELVP